MTVKGYMYLKSILLPLAIVLLYLLIFFLSYSRQHHL